MSNIVRIQNALQEAEYSAVLVTSAVNRRFATGFPASAGMALIARDGVWFFTDSRYIEAAKLRIPDAEVRLSDRENPYAQLINSVCEERGYTSLAFEDAAMTFAEHKRLSEKLTVELTEGSELLSRLRMVKSRPEVDAMIRAQRLSEQAFQQILPLITTEITEKELAAELVCAMLRLGADDVSFDPIIVSGPRSSMPHGVPTDTKLSRGFLTLDFGVLLDGWCSDTTRTLCLGEPTDEERRVYDVVLEAQLAGIAAVRADIPGAEIDMAARDIIQKNGYGEYFGHGFGHGLGMEVHEAPNASPTYGGNVPEGAVISAEPGIYLPGRFGVRIEDVVWVCENGCINLTELPKELYIVNI